MPKINVYLPDALADRVREARLPVSRICQAALTQALDGATRATHDTAAELSLPEPVDLTPPPNHHVAAILRGSYEAAAARGSATVDPVDVLRAFLDEGESLVLNAVELLGFPAASIRAAIDDAPDGPAAPIPGRPEAAATPTMAAGTRAVLTVATDQAAAHGAAVTTGSHLLLGLIRDAGGAGAVLRAVGVPEVVTPAVLSALYYGVALGQLTPGRDPDTAALRVMMLDVIERLDRLQHHVVASR